jgi:hypothetical protein
MDIFKKDLGPEGSVAIVLEGGALKLNVEHHGANGGKEVLSVEEPVLILLEPVIDKMVDKLEQAVPGDQTGLAQEAKQALHKALLG